MSIKADHIEGRLEEAKGTIKETFGALIGGEKLEAEGAIQKNLGEVQAGDGDAKQDHFKIVAIYPNFADVGDAIFLLKNEGFTDDQISLLGREQEHWQEKLGNEWEAHKTAKFALAGGALGAVPGLVLVAGIAITGGVGLLVAGPMLAALSALGLGSLAGSLMGAGSSVADTTLSVEEEVANAISLGHWVVIVHCHTDAEAAHAQGLLPNRRIVRDNDFKAMAPSDLAAAEQADMQKLAAVVQEAFLPVRKASAKLQTQLASIRHKLLVYLRRIGSPTLISSASFIKKAASTGRGSEWRLFVGRPTTVAGEELAPVWIFLKTVSFGTVTNDGVTNPRAS